MKKVTFALAILMSLGLAGCANTDIYSGNVYEGNQAKEVRSISYGTIVSSRPVKIQADSQGVLGGFGGGALGGIVGSGIGGGTGQMIATTVGAIAGAVIGAKAEEKLNQVDSLELVIKKDNGQEIVVVQKYDQSLVPGARVRIVGGSKVNISVIH
ncbi:TPA: glycine zipper 2TM domain-containing protein [Pasteurella multocida]